MAARKNSKGQKRAALKRLMRSVPEGESLFRILIGLGDNSWEADSDRDRTAAIMGATFLEYALRDAICTHLEPDADDPKFSYLFDSDEAPYRELAGRVRLARALGIIDKAYFEQLEAIRHIRNAFAHTLGELTFQTSEIAAYFDELHILHEEQNLATVMEAFAPEHTFVGALPSKYAHRLGFTQAIFLFYWKLLCYRALDTPPPKRQSWR